MTLALRQADAIESMLRLGEGNGRFSADAVLSCSDRLIEHGEGQRVLDLVQLASGLFGTLPEDFRLRLEVRRCRALFIMNRDSACLESVRAAISTFAEALLRDEESAQILRVYEGASLWRLNRVPEALERLRALRTQLMAKPDSLILAMTALYISSAHVALGDWEGTLRFAMEAAVSARRVGSPLWEAHANMNACIAERGMCHWSSSESYGRAALEGFNEARNAFSINHAKRSLAITQWKRGRLVEAEELSTRCIDDALARGHDVQWQYAVLLRSLILLHRGLSGEALEALSNNDRWTAPDSSSRVSLLRGEYVGDTFLESGDYASALRRYDEVWPKAIALLPEGDVAAEVRRRRAECLLHAGTAEAALAEASDALTACRRIKDRYEEAATYRILALALAALGKASEARAAFEQGFAMYDDIETPYEWGKLWMSYGDWLCGEHAAEFRSLSGASEAYRAAIGHFEHIGAELKLKQARERLASLEQKIAFEGVESASGESKIRPLRRPRLSTDLRRRSQWAFDTFGIVTRNRQILDMLDEVARIAKSDMPVLILGQSGTGKELVANGVHRLSGRTGRFVPINCGAIPATMIEDELFGHVDGAFTNAIKEKAGLFEVAHEGTAFLDEIGEMSVELQSKLLRFLESGEFRRIGGTAHVRVSTRIVAATNRDRARLESGESFRTDLYYRLAHAVYTLPPLSQRGDDVELLIEHFLDGFCDEHRKRVSFSTAAMEKLTTHGWPGNVRQLRSVVQRVVVQSKPDHVVTPIELALSDDGGGRAGLEAEMEREERTRIVEALEKTDYVKAEAARLLRMSRTTLIAKMKRLGITD